MEKHITCIECPLGCSLSVDIENCRVVKVSGNKCPKGSAYAVSEIENPSRVLTSSVRAQGLELTMVPVRTDKPIPKARLIEGMGVIRAIRVTRGVAAGDVIAENFLGLGVNLIAGRAVRERSGRRALGP